MTSAPAKRVRYRTYVDGFDENLNGGIPQGHTVIVAGAAGTMKSSLAYHILFMNAKRDGVNGLYISLEQSKQSLTRQMEGLGLKGDTLGRLEVLDLTEIRRKSEGAQFMVDVGPELLGCLCIALAHLFEQARDFTPPRPLC